MREKIKNLYQSIGLPRLIIVCFFVMLLLSAGSLKLSILGLLGDAVRRSAMYGILVLAMVPAVQSGIGQNFGISLGIVGGLLGATITVELGVANPWLALLCAMAIGGLLGSIVGIGYGMLLNKVKGSEMTVSTYVGFSIIAFMNM
jgi:simple sugar transport system permease protein